MSKKKKDKKSKKKKLEKGKSGKAGLTYLFVDSENVGNLVPASLPSDVEVYFFLSDVNVYRKVYELLDLPNFHVVDVLKITSSQRREKNEMDFVIVAYLSNLLSSGVRKKDSYVILSRDKGYDKAMEVLLSENKKLSLVREELNLREKVEGVAFFPGDPILHAAAVSNSDYESFRSSLSLGQRKRLRLEVIRNPKSGASGWFEHDIYTGEYLLYYSGSFVARFPSIEAGRACQAELLGTDRKNRVRALRNLNLLA